MSEHPSDAFAPAAVSRVAATATALELLGALRAEHGDLLLHQSGGCCEGSSPMCYTVKEFLVSPNDVCLGQVGDVPFYMSKAQFEYWRHTHITLDVVDGYGGAFSLENGTGKCFHTRSRLFSDAEWAELERREKI